MAQIPSAQLQKILDRDLEPIEKDDSGTIYDDIFIWLQIRPESCRLFFEHNVRPFRNKKDILKLILRGTEAAQRKLSESILASLGGTVWSNDRHWVLRADELQPGEEPLRYVFPKDRQPGDHEAFHPPLKLLWQRMRVAIFELKPSHRNKDQDAASSSTNSILPSSETRSMPSEMGTATQMDTNLLNTSRRNMWEITETEIQENIVDRKQKLRDRALNGTRERTNAPPPAPNNITPHGAAMNTSENMHPTAQNSHTEAFGPAYQETMARLADIIERNRLPEARGGATTLARGRGGQTGNQPNTHGQQPMDTTTAATTPVASQVASNAVTLSTNPVRPANSPWPAAAQPLGVEVHRLSMPHPQLQLIGSHPANTIYVYVAPINVPSSSSDVQPVQWQMVLVHPDSFQYFVRYVLSRANVPPSMVNMRKMMVLSYCWTSVSRVIQGESDWRNFIMNDLRDAITRLDVRVRRVRCSLFVC